MKSKVLIRVDGGNKFGLGHLIRSFALGQMLTDSFEVIFVCKEIPLKIKLDFEQSGCKVVLISEEEEFMSLIEFDNIIVLDGYHFDENFQKSIRSNGAKLACIDDLHDKEFFADLIINHAPGVSIDDYHKQSYTELALGPDYALLRPEFLNKSSILTKKNAIEHVLICFGGADPKNLTAQILNIVLSYPDFKKIDVVTGASYDFINELEEVIKLHSHVSHYNSVDENQMLNLMSAVDVGIVPASGILYEMLALKKIVITGMYIENQRIFLREFAKIRNVVSAEDFGLTQVQKALDYIFQNDITPEVIIDGLSKKRLLEMFNKLKKRIYLITGANGGLGSALTDQILAKNNSVLSLSRRLSDEQLKLEQNNDNFYFIKHDLSSTLEVDKLDKIYAVLNKYQEIVFVNNAGTINPIVPFKDIEDEELTYSLAINVVAPSTIIKFLLRNFSGHRIDFVNITSGAANKSIENWSLYAASKSFILRIFETMAEENKANANYRFISVDPGMIDTKMQEEIRASDFPASDSFLKAKISGVLLSPLQAAVNVLNKLG